ncbi:MAG: CCA tRNA nucleotidyltransferase [Lachnospiraceae bacterium]|nr:CCA tRNA nucleotidyltransferase [Lachnospiraceae bacterium]
MYNLENLTIKVPEEAGWILKKLREAGYEGYCVGGCVRDCLLGRVPEDWDITTSALPFEVKSLFCNTVDTGIQHGTVMVIRNGHGYEVTTYRIDGEYKDGRHPEKVEFTRSLEEDLKRRDFTINAFAYNEESGVVDLFGGIEDLNHSLIKAVGDPDERFSEDALRIMRAIRFAAQLSFEIEENTYQAIQRHAENLAKVSMERIRVEFEKTLLSKNPDMVRKFFEMSMGNYIVPSFEEDCRDFDEKLAFCLADDFAEDKERRKYLLLAVFLKKLSYDEARTALRRMKYDNKTRDLVSAIIRYKDEALTSDRVSIKNALNTMGVTVFQLIMTLKEAEGKRDENEKQLQLIREIKELVKDIMEKEEPYSLAQLAVNGRDLIEAGVSQGTEVGKTLEKLLGVVIENPAANTKENLLKLI